MIIILHYLLLHGNARARWPPLTHDPGRWGACRGSIGGSGGLADPSGKDIDDGILYEGGKDEHEANDHPHVNGFYVGDSGQGRPAVGL